MKKIQFRLCSLVLALALLLPLVIRSEALEQGYETKSGDSGDYTAAVLFTQDLHEQFLPAKDEEGRVYGGMSRLSSMLSDRRRVYPHALTVDAGDFSMGSLFQSIYASHAPELRLMGLMGYDAVTLGNHEFDYRPEGLSQMLTAAAESGAPLPALVDSNYLPREAGEEGYSQTDQMVWDAMEQYGVKDYVILNRGGINYGIFGIYGHEAHEEAPLSGMTLDDPVETAQRTVDSIRAEADPDTPLFIICLSHSGINTGKEAEDEILAREVDGIDLLVSGHSHVVLEEPMEVEDTLIVSGGSYSQYLGEIVVHWNEDGTRTGYEYRLFPVTESVACDPRIDREIENYQAIVVEEYLSRFGYSGYDQVLVENEVTFDSISSVGQLHQESMLGDLITDAYRYAVAQAEGDEGVPVDLAVTASGVIRASLPLGPVTVSDAFSVSSLGIGADGVAGYPLVAVYLTGEDIQNVFEVDASVTALMPVAQLHFSGMGFRWNPNRMIFDKVTDCWQIGGDGAELELEKDRLYRVVTGLYCGQMLGAVEAQSFGILSVTPRDAQGQPIDMSRIEDYIVHDQNGAEVKEWAAVAGYLQSFGEEGVPTRYRQTQGRKVSVPSWNPVELLRGCSQLTFGILCLVLGLVLLAVLGVSRLRKWLRKRKRPDLRQRGAGESYSGGRGSQHNVRPAGPRLSGYTGSRRNRHKHQPKLFSGLSSYTGRKRGGASGAKMPKDWNRRYKG